MTSTVPERLIVADASPLIGLVKINRLGLLRRLAKEIWIPREVWTELIDNGGDRPEVAELAAFLSGAVQDIDPVQARRFSRQVDPGESAAVALATANPGCLLLIDDAAGRRLAESLGVRCVGVGGLLLRAKRAGLVPSLTIEMSALRAHGYYLGDKVTNELLKAAGEPSSSSGQTTDQAF